MAGLQRSEMSFRRSGSSGLVWDDKFLSGEIKKAEDDEDQDNDKEIRPARMERSRSANAAGGGGFRTVKASPPNIDPPSPKLSGCGICGMFGKPADASSFLRNKPRINKRKS